MRTDWFHVTFSTFGTWLRGDDRGFRDHDHRIHSSGNYRNPPPAAEHEGLRRWTHRVMHKEPVVLSADLRARVGKAMVARLLELETQPLALSVGGEHVHLLARLPNDGARKVIGLAKSRASHAIRDVVPGSVWGRRCGLRMILDRRHHTETFRYILEHREEGAWVWTFRDAVPAG